jgi:AcrR family transcriptional regulator
MSRWKPDATGRLEQAAFELFRDRGYDQVTVADIAKRAGLTERTFFRHYADKREVLFAGAAVLREELLEALGAVPRGVPTIEAVQIAVEAISALLHGRRALARERQKIVKAHADLLEREMIKRATLTDALAEALHERGVAEPGATLAADIGVGVFYVSFVHWLDGPEDREFVDVVHEGFKQIRGLAAGTGV